jgi:L-threonylcarbamoyladenylate synthase
VKANEKVANAFLSERGTVGMRMPGGEIATDLIARLGCPIATTSANISGHANACSFDELEPEILSKVAVALSDGEVKRGIASTVVDCSLGEHPVLLREGTITESDIASLLAKSSLV